jgi:HD-GYP domain-containing protein (c-di-GMP phosphodiesterase class II)
MGVMEAAVSIGRQLGMSGDRLQMLRRAALLHDVGKLGVPNSILDKNGKLTDEEFMIVKRHPSLSQQILCKVGAFREIAAIAGEHHERLDRSGYPHRLCAEDMSIESRILGVADVYGALSEDRPYRGGLDLATIASIMEKDIPGKLDKTCYEALRGALDGPGVKDAAAGAGFTKSLLPPISERAMAVMHPRALQCFTPACEALGREAVRIG